VINKAHLTNVKRIIVNYVSRRHRGRQGIWADIEWLGTLKLTGDRVRVVIYSRFYQTLNL